MRSFSSFLIVFFLLLFPALAIAQDTFPEASVSPSPEIKSSFELFWPLAAGKTIDDPVYFLKSFKEEIRGLFIFGKTSKIEYLTDLGTKRLLEAEKLISLQKDEPTKKTLQKALQDFQKAERSIDDAINKGEKVSVNSSLQNRLNNLEVFLTRMIASDSGKFKDQLQENLNIVQSIKTKL